MKFLNAKTNIDFMGKRGIAMVLSIVLLVASVGSLLVRGLNFGLDFTGGTLIEVSFPEAPEIADVRARLGAAGLDNAVVQTFGTATDIVVRVPPER